MHPLQPPRPVVCGVTHVREPHARTSVTDQPLLKHAVFALFRDRFAADRAIRQLVEREPALASHISVVVHRGVVDEAELRHTIQHASAGAEETDSRRGLTIGASLGAGAGALIGALIAGPFGLLGGGPLIGMLFGAGAGSLYGMLAGGLVGGGLPDQTLKQLASRIQGGDVLVTVRTDGHDVEQRAAAILRTHGADIASKQMGQADAGG